FQRPVCGQVRPGAPIGAMPGKIGRTLCRPENIIEHERVHRHKDRGWRGTGLRVRVYRRVIKRCCELEEGRGGGTVRVAESLSALYLPAPRTRLENEADA